MEFTMDDAPWLLQNLACKQPAQAQDFVPLRRDIKLFYRYALELRRRAEDRANFAFEGALWYRFVRRHFQREWAELRVLTFALYPWRCMCCRPAPEWPGCEWWGDRSFLHVDHVYPVLTNPERYLDIFNLQILCITCNLRRSKRGDVDYRVRADIERLVEISGLPFKHVCGLIGRVTS